MIIVYLTVNKCTCMTRKACMTSTSYVAFIVLLLSWSHGNQRVFKDSIKFFIDQWTNKSARPLPYKHSSMSTNPIQPVL